MLMPRAARPDAQPTAFTEVHVPTPVPLTSDSCLSERLRLFPGEDRARTSGSLFTTGGCTAVKSQLARAPQGWLEGNHRPGSCNRWEPGPNDRSLSMLSPPIGRFLDQNVFFRSAWAVFKVLNMHHHSV